MADGICSVDGCARPTRTRGFCAKHYMRWHKYGDPLVVAFENPKRERPDVKCSVEDCEAWAQSRGWCKKHYWRWQRNGDPLVASTKPRPPAYCSVEGCQSPRASRGLCHMHYSRWKRHGDVETVLLKRPAEGEVTYSAVHIRLRRARGLASEFPCVDCGRPARDWSYNNSGISERSGPNQAGFVMRYSTDLAQYEPRCRACHIVFDRQ